MIAFIATLIVKPGQEAEFEGLQAELSELSHKHESGGLLVYDVIRDQDQSNRYVVYARFRDQDAFDAHQVANYHERLVPPILDCLAEEMDLQFFTHVA